MVQSSFVSKAKACPPQKNEVTKTLSQVDVHRDAMKVPSGCYDTNPKPEALAKLPRTSASMNPKPEAIAKLPRTSALELRLSLMQIRVCVPYAPLPNGYRETRSKTH
jgi:hypothetical protein